MGNSYSYVCTCTPGYAGPQCDIMINVCQSNPCIRGACNYQSNLWFCACPIGYTGLRCEVQVNYCSMYNPACLNNGTCINDPDNNSYKCVCPLQYTGYRCESDICTARNPCLNGDCASIPTGYICNCRNGFTGQNCGQSIDLCSTVTCLVSYKIISSFLA